MPRIPATTNAQTTFLRTFRTSPTGPAPADWPAPALLRRWLRRPGFVTALHSLRDALGAQVDLQLAAAAAQALQSLTTHPADLSPQHLRRFADLLRLAHLRQRFPTQPKLDSPATFSLRDEISDRESALKTLRKRPGKGHPTDATADNPPNDPRESADDDNDNDEDDDPSPQAYERGMIKELARLRALANPLQKPKNPGPTP